MMAGFISSLLLILTIFITGTTSQIEIRGITLTQKGQEQQYINFGSGDLEDYKLECHVQANPSDVTNITWTLEGVPGRSEVYTWVRADAQVAGKNGTLLGDTGVETAYDPLKGHVWTGSDDGEKAGPDILFISPKPSMRGVYTCNVYHNRLDMAANPVSAQYSLHMYAFYDDVYNLTGQLDKCTFYWNYSSPLMFPQPEVHCGLWNTSSGLEVKRLYGGLTHHQYINRTWHVYGGHIPLQVKDIPRGSLFQCQAKVPMANYTHTATLPVDPSTQQLYDAVEKWGCPRLPTLPLHMDVLLSRCRHDCRDECHQVDQQPVQAKYECDPGYVAYWEEQDRLEYRWTLPVFCYDDVRLWVSELDGTAYHNLSLPYCVGNGASSLFSTVDLMIISAVFFTIATSLVSTV